MRSSATLSIAAAAALTFAAGSVPAQQSAPATSTRTTTGGNTPTRQTTAGQVTTTDTGGPIILAGKVTMEDGGPPPDSVAIELVCNGAPRPQTYTTARGHFSFQVGQNNSVLPDASMDGLGDSVFGLSQAGGGQRQQVGNLGGVRGGVTQQQLWSCELRAALPGYRSDTVNLAGRRSMQNPDVGTIVLHRRANVEGATISMTSRDAPREALKAYDKGIEALKKKKASDAEKDFHKAVASYPKYATAWFGMGMAQEMQNRPEEARKAYMQSLEADPRFVKPYLQLAAIAVRGKQWRDAANFSGRIIKLDPYDFPQAYYYNAVSNYFLGNLETAEKSAREAQRLDPQHRIPKSLHILGVILADRRDFGGAAASMREYLKVAPAAQDAESVRAQADEFERLAATSKQP